MKTKSFLDGTYSKIGLIIFVMGCVLLIQGTILQEKEDSIHAKIVAISLLGGMALYLFGNPLEEMLNSIGTKKKETKNDRY